MKCGIHIIHDGGRYSPSKYEVLKKCGEPRSLSENRDRREGKPF